MGSKRIADRLSQLAQQFAPLGVAGFFEPCEYLKRCAAAGTKLGAGKAQASKM